MHIFMTNRELPQNLSNRGVQNKYVNKYYVMHALKKSLQQKKVRETSAADQIRCHRIPNPVPLEFPGNTVKKTYIIQNITLT